MSKLTKLVISTGLLVAILVALGVTINYVLSGGRNPMMLLNFVASGIFGDDAFGGHKGMAFIGLGLHTLISFAWTIFFIKTRQLRAVTGWTSNCWISGIIYGLIIWFVMAMIVMPASNAPFAPLEWTSSLVDLGIVVLGAGLPISLMTRNLLAYEQKQTEV